MFFNKEIIFEKQNHSYKNKWGEDYISVSQLISLFSPKFDPDGSILKKCALREGIEEKDLQQKWDKIRDDSCITGKKLHSDLENYIKTSKFPKRSDENFNWVKQFSKIKFNGKLQTEVLIYNHKYKVAGTTDLIHWTDENCFELYDFKSNKKIDTYEIYGNRMLYPLSHLYATNYNKYSLQINIYAFLLEELGYWRDGILKMLHFNPKTKKIESYEISPMEKEIKSLFMFYERK